MFYWVTCGLYFFSPLKIFLSKKTADTDEMPSLSTAFVDKFLYSIPVKNGLRKRIIPDTVIALKANNVF